MGAEERKRLKEQVADRMGGLASHPVSAEDSVDWYNESFLRCDGWADWIWRTVSMVDYHTRKPRFSAFVVCTDPLGRANAGIVKLALRKKCPVFAWADKAPLRVVEALSEDNPDDWIGGWSVRSTEIGK